MPDTTWLGRPGSLIEIRDAQAGMPRTADPGASVMRTLDGHYRVQRRPSACRTWGLTWPWMDEDEWRPLHALHTRQYGPGPWVLLHPTIRNYATPNQASGSNALADTTGWVVDEATTTETLSVVTSPVYQGTRSLRWSIPSPVPAGVLYAQGPLAIAGDDYYRYHASPVGQEWTWWVQARSGGTDSVISASVRLSWYSSAGAFISTSAGSVTALSAAAWTRLTVTGTAPADTAYMQPTVLLSGATVSAATQIHIGAARLLMGPDDETWEPGEGMPLVSITELSESVPLLGRTDAGMTLVEVS